MVEDMGSILQKVGFFFCHWQSHKQYILSFPVFVLPRWKWNRCKTQLDNMHYGNFFECIVRVNSLLYCPHRCSSAKSPFRMHTAKNRTGKLSRPINHHIATFYTFLLTPHLNLAATSVPDPWHFGVDPDPDPDPDADPRIHVSDYWIRILLFASLTFKTTTKNN